MPSTTSTTFAPSGAMRWSGTRRTCWRWWGGRMPNALRELPPNVVTELVELLGGISRERVGLLMSSLAESQGMTPGQVAECIHEIMHPEDPSSAEQIAAPNHMPEQVWACAWAALAARHKIPGEQIEVATQDVWRWRSW